MKMNRRNLVKSVLGFGTLMGLQGAALPAQAALSADSLSEQNLLELRKKARRRIRRMIMNNDGNDVGKLAGLPVTPESFLRARTAPLIGSLVDSIFYCDGVNDKYTHRSELTELPFDSESKMRVVNEFKRYDTDPLEIIVNFCRQYDKEVFWSMRMNDTHDTAVQAINKLTKWKREHPDCLMAAPGPKSSFPFLHRWSALDYGKDEVRRRVADIIQDVLIHYDVDGIELDFFRHPIFFKSTFNGGVASQDECDLMTKLLVDIRAICDNEAIKRGKPVLIGVRVPDSIGFAADLGLDLVSWLEQDIVDIMTAGCYFKMEPWENWANLGRRYHIPVYAALEGRRLVATLEAEDISDPSRWRQEAFIAWNAGVNGIYTFNLFDPYDPLFHELGDPNLLRDLPRSGGESYVSPLAKGVLEPETWLKGGRRHLKKSVD